MENKPSLLSIIDDTILNIETQMKSYPGRFLNSDPNQGLSEFSFQLLLYTNLINQRLQGYTITLEKILEGYSRCDLFIRNDETNEVFIIELKYIRISYLKASRQQFTNDGKKYQKVLEDVYSKIKDDSKEKLLTLLKWSEYIVSTKDNNTSVKEFKYEPIQKVLNKAEIQAMNYAKQYQNMLDWRTKQTKIYYLVIIGIGFRIIRGVMNLYKK